MPGTYWKIQDLSISNYYRKNSSKVCKHQIDFLSSIFFQYYDNLKGKAFEYKTFCTGIFDNGLINGDCQVYKITDLG